MAIASSSLKPEDEHVSIEEIVFSCSICQALVSEVYSTTESNQGFHSGAGDEDGIVTKMWITECSHVTCAKHLEGGAAPFHPKDMAPKAACPKCFRDKGDESLKELFGIRGLQEGEYDTHIPLDWLRCPSIKLDSTVPGMMALRFQYMALYNYSLQIRKRWKHAQQKQTLMETAYSKERKQRREAQTELHDAQQRIQTLENTEAQLRKWEDRKPMIEQCMGVFPRMSSDIESMRAQLLGLGVVVPRTDYAYSKPAATELRQPRAAQQHHHARKDERSSDDAALHAPTTYENSSSTRKRKREYLEADGRAERRAGLGMRPEPSRDLMPPPLPKAQPQLCRNDENQETHAPQHTLQPPLSRQPIEVYRDNSWTRAPEKPLQSYEAGSVHGSAQSQPGHSSQRVLPYRPVASNNMSQETLYEQRPYVDPSHARRNLQPTHNDVQSVNNAACHPSTIHDPRSDRCMPRDGEFRAPLQVLSQSDTNKRLPTGSQDHHAWQYAALDRGSQQAAPAIPSPFFRPDMGTFRSPTLQRPPTRGNFVQRLRDVSIANNRAAHEASPVWQVQQRGNHDVRASNMPPSHALSRGQRNQQFAHVPLYVTNDSARYRPSESIPQTPRNSDGLFHRPDRLPAAAPSHTATRPQSNAYRNRISLAPRSGPAMPIEPDQDRALLQVPGIRGVRSQRGPSSYQHSGVNTYGTARNPFSAAGGRRTAMR